MKNEPERHIGLRAAAASVALVALALLTLQFEHDTPILLKRLMANL